MGGAEELKTLGAKDEPQGGKLVVGTLGRSEPRKGGDLQVAKLLKRATTKYVNVLYALVDPLQLDELVGVSTSRPSSGGQEGGW